MNTLFGFLPILMGVPQGADGSTGSGGGSFVTTIITFGLVILIFYFLIIRPQSRKQKETKRMLAAVKKGDRVVTVGGIRGTVMSVKDETVVLKVDDTTKMEFSKSALSNILSAEEVKKENARPEKKKLKAAEAPAEEAEQAEQAEEAEN